MATYTKLPLSGAADGKGVKVVATSTTGTTIHTAHSTSLDEIWLFVVNTSTSAVKLTLEWGTTTAADGNIEITIPPESGLYQVVPGLLLTNSLLVTAFAGSANVLLVFGYVNRIS